MILITGADGFVGSNLVKCIDSDIVIALDYTLNKSKNIPSEVMYINGDLSLYQPDLSDYDIDTIIHLATNNQIAVGDTPDLVNKNMAMMQNVISLCLQHKSKLIYTSSCSVYGDGKNMPEIHPYAPTTLYAVGKVFDEELIKYYNRVSGLDSTILRFSNCYGDTTEIDNKVYPGKRDVVHIFMNAAHNHKPLPIIRGMTRDYTYIDDVIDAIKAVIPLSGCNIFNVATGVPTSIEDLGFKVCEVLGEQPSFKEIGLRKTDTVTYRYLNVDKIKNYWEPKVSLDEGLKKYATSLFG